MTSSTKHPLSGFRALAFDFDGTLVDTLPLHYEAYRLTFLKIGIELSEDDFYSNIGGKATEAIPLFLRGRPTEATIQEIHAMKKTEITRLFGQAPLKLCPTSRLLGMFVGVMPLALVSSGSRPGIEQLLERLGWSDHFDVIVTGEDTPCSKPDPAPYQLAAERLGVPAGDMAAFEDTEAGVESARRAGMAVFDVAANSSFPWP